MITELPNVLIPVLIPFVLAHTSVHFRKDLTEAMVWVDRRLISLRRLFRFMPPWFWQAVRLVTIWLVMVSIVSHALIAVLHGAATMQHA